MTPAATAAAYTESAGDRARAVLIQLSRKDSATFASYILRDEETGKRVKLAPVHERWHAAMQQHDRLVITSHIEAGKTAQVSVAKPIHQLGKDPNRRILVVSNTGDQARKVIRTIGQYIKKSPDVRAVFPSLRPTTDLNLPWSSQSLTVERSIISKDPSVQAVGIGGAVMGARVDDLILDDVLDFENTRTMHQMDQVFAWLRSTALGRLTSRSNVWALTNAWHPRDPMQRLVKELGYHHEITPVMDAATGALSWPERWPAGRISKARVDLGPLEFGRQLMCQVRDDEQARFHQAWLDKCLDRGRGFATVHSIEPGDLPPGYAVFTGVDLAVQQHSSADMTVFFTILLWPTGERQVLWVEAGRWSGPEIVKKVDEHGQRYGGLIVVENNAAQDYILQFSRLMTRSSVRAFTTGKNKVNPAFGVESLAAEMESARWIIPNARTSRRLNVEVGAWLNEMLYYNPKEHTGDRLMSSWFAREGARAFERSLGRTYNAAQEVEVMVAGESGTDSVSLAVQDDPLLVRKKKSGVVLLR